MAHSTHNVNLKQPRVAEIREILQGAVHGLKTPEVAERLGTNTTTARKLLVAMKAGGLISLVGSSGSAFWCLHGMAKRITADLAKQRTQRRRTRARKAYRSRLDAGVICAGGLKIEVPDVPFIHRVVQVWAPVRQPPGPPSIFHCGGML